MTGGQIQFLNPAWFWLLPGLAAAAWLLRRRLEHAATAPSGARQNRFTHPLLLRLQLATELRGRAGSRPGRWLYWLAFACFVTALAQPQRIGEQLPVPPPHRDITLVVDDSISMALRDYVLDGRPITRMTALKGILGRFVSRLHGDRLSVVVYGDHPYTLVPMTEDHGLAQKMLARLSIGLAGRTNGLGEAVALAVKQSSAAPKARRVLMLFSDGARPVGPVAPRAAAALAAAHKIRLYTIAIGAVGGSSAAKQAAGLVYDPADRARLQQMATMTGGRYYAARDTGSLARVIRDIEQLERPSSPAKPRRLRQALYPWPLLLGLLLLAAGQWRDLRRGRS
ncbi:MAG: VWA domain-containing protein [Gammaproteobacteria bacterium]